MVTSALHGPIQGYSLAYVEEAGSPAVLAIAGFKVQETLAVGRFLYVDDLVCDRESQRKGLGAMLFAWLKQHALAQQCGSLVLDSGWARAPAAHEFYKSMGMTDAGLHFTMVLREES